MRSSQKTKKPTVKHSARASAVKEKIEFGRGFGRGSGFYRQWIKKSDPDSEEAREARKEARDQARDQAHSDAKRAEQAARDAKDREERHARRQQEHEQSRDRGHAQQDRESQQHRGHEERTHTKGSAARPAVLDFDKMRRASWEEYDRSFVAFRERALLERTFKVSDVPLPPKGQVIESAASPEDWHKHLRAALLRWHPDKWASLASMLSDASDREYLKQLTQGMFRAVSRAKDKGFDHVRFPARSAMWADPFQGA